MTSGHPEIPPNLEWFFFKHGDEGYWWCSTGSDLVCVDRRANYYRPDMNQKKIIASLAYCAWMDEDDRLLDDVGEITDTEETKKRIEQYREKSGNANEQARAWREWGKP